ncbi:MAG: hypothetical protein VXW65_04505 [Pseudomonadota bacterium]|nr:hypothetical protein [Pseudomonadota bacterium]
MILSLQYPIILRSLGLALSIGLTGCGGGGGSTSSTPSPKPNPAQPTPVQPPTQIGELTLTGDQQGLVGQRIGVVGQRPKGQELQFISYEWQQLTGSPVTLSGQRQAAMSFVAPNAGAYRFELTATHQTGQKRRQIFNIQVNAAATSPAVNLQIDRAVSSGGLLTLRLTPRAQHTIQDWQFKQLSGTTAQLQVSPNEPIARVIAPNVVQDEVLVFEGTSSNGQRDLAYVLVQRQPTINSPFFCDRPATSCATTTALSHHYAYQRSTPYNDQLLRCTFSNQLTDAKLCNVGTLPPLNQNDLTPSIAEVMQRVVVSEDWMGQQFEQFLRQHDQHQDFLNLLKPVTAIIISPNITQSFYFALTGAIYLHPDYLWLTAQQRDSLIEEPDFRTEFGQDLSFLTSHWYVKNGDFATGYWPITERKSRTLSEMSLPLAALLYHELAHANDFYPAQRLRSLQTHRILAEQLDERLFPSTTLTQRWPLHSGLLKELAQVSFAGVPATSTQRQLQPTQVAEAFFSDRASDFYGYLDQYEDAAMLFEESMMLLRYGIARDVFVMNLPQQQDSQGRPIYIMTQGQRHRVADPAVSPRALSIISQLMPELTEPARRVMQQNPALALCAEQPIWQSLSLDCYAKQKLHQGHETPHPASEQFHQRLLQQQSQQQRQISQQPRAIRQS